MKIAIRYGVFETNSSSTHSISIDYSNNLDDVPRGKGDDNVILCKGDEFGWGYTTHNDFDTKLQYLITYIFSNCENAEQAREKAKTDKNFLLIKETVRKYSGCLLEFRDDPTDPPSWYYPFGYIDHESTSIALDALTDVDTLKNYLFNPRSELVIDNDNRY